MSKGKADNESNNSSLSSDTESFETLSLNNESFFSFKTSSTKISIKSLSKSIFDFAKDIFNSVRDKWEELKELIFKEEQKQIEKRFLGYYECLIPGNAELSIPKIFLSTARIDLHEKTLETSDKAKPFVLTKIKESPYIKNTSLFIITGKGINNDSKKFTEFPKWMQEDSIKALVDDTAKGNGTYKVLIKKIENTDVYKDIKLKKLEKKAKKENGYKYKMALAGFYMLAIGIKGVTADNWYKKAIKWYRRAEKSGSIEAKLCLGYMYSIGFNHYDPEKAKKLFKEVIHETMKEITSNNEAIKENVTKTDIKNAMEEKTTDKSATKESITATVIVAGKETTGGEIADGKATEGATADEETTEETTADKEVIEEITNKEVTEDNNKELARIAMRNIATLYHNSYAINPFELKNIRKVSKPSDFSFKKLPKMKLKLAIKWYKRSCELGDSKSAYHLGLLYERNEIKIKKNSNNEEDNAEYWYKMAVRLDDNLYAKAKLGKILINKGEKIDGIKMLKDAAEKGLVMGQAFLGEAYEKEEDYKEAAKFYFEAARKNHGYYSHFAQYRLKELYSLMLIQDENILKNIQDIINLYVEELDIYYENEEMVKDIHENSKFS